MGLAVRGSQWAMAVSIGVGALALMMTVYAMLFGLVWAFSLIGHREPAAGSPFAPQMATSNARQRRRGRFATDAVTQR